MASLVSLPEDIFVKISTTLTPTELLSLTQTCRTLHRLITNSTPLWHSQCLKLLLYHSIPLHLWRAPLPSYLHLCRFLFSLQPLLNHHLWVHQNPELGNLVVLLPTFLSFLAVRILPQQELSSSPILFSPVFEVVADRDGSVAGVLLHSHLDRVSPASAFNLVKDANVLLLEVDGERQHPLDPTVSFGKMGFKDRRRLLEFVAGEVTVRLPAGGTGEVERWEALLRVLKSGAGRIGRKEAKLRLDGADLEEEEVDRGKRKSFAGTVGGYVMRMIGKKGVGFLPESNHQQRQHLSMREFLASRDSIGLSLRAVKAKVTTFKGWPRMNDNKFALYKLPMQIPRNGREFAGLWGGTFGWPPGQTSEDKPGKALFFVLLGYEEVGSSLVLTGTKILEGTYYVLHPNGSAMFVVNVGEPSEEPFPWATDGSGRDVEVVRSFSGEGIASGYGFRYPGSKPGSLYLIQGGRLLAFVWSESKAVLTLQRMDLHELLKNGERVAAPPPISNFAYLTKSYSNVFVGFANGSSSSQVSRLDS